MEVGVFLSSFTGPAVSFHLSKNETQTLLERWQKIEPVLEVLFGVNTHWIGKKIVLEYWEWKTSV